MGWGQKGKRWGQKVTGGEKWGPHWGQKGVRWGQKGRRGDGSDGMGTKGDRR